MPKAKQVNVRRAARIIAECRRWHPQFRNDCVDFAAAVMARFFSRPLFDGNVFSDDAVALLRRGTQWRRTRSIPEAITAAKAGQFVIAGLTSAEVGGENGHLAVVAGEDGQLSGSVIVPMGYAGSIGGASIFGERLTGTFRAPLVRQELVDYFISTPDIEPASEALEVLRHAERLATHTRPRAAPSVVLSGIRTAVPRMAFGRRVTPAFRMKAFAAAARLGIEVDHLMAVIAFESAGTFKADVRNPLSGAVGLIQFMPKTAVSLGTTIDALAKLSPEEQLDWVERYFQPWKGRMGNLSDTYMAVLWPRAIGKPDDYALFAAPSKAYEQNKGLDRNQDDRVTKHEAAWKVAKALGQGLSAANYG